MRTNVQVVLALVASAGFAGSVYAQTLAAPYIPGGQIVSGALSGLDDKRDVGGSKAASKVDLEYKPQKPDGSPIGPSKADAAAGKGVVGKDVAAAASRGRAGGSAADNAGFGFGVPDVSKTPTPGGPLPIPYPNTPIDVKPPVVKAPLPILRPIDTPRPILTPTLPIIAQPVPVAPKPVIVEPIPQPGIKVPYSAPVNRR